MRSIFSNLTDFLAEITKYPTMFREYASLIIGEYRRIIAVAKSQNNTYVLVAENLDEENYIHTCDMLEEFSFKHVEEIHFWEG
jgi:hypothetical protein